MKTTIIKKPGHPLLHLILGVAGGLSLIILLILLFVSGRISAPLVHQQGASRWAGDGTLDFEQVSVFQSIAQSLDPSVIESAGQSVDNKLNEAGIPEANYLICYGGETSVAISSESGGSSAEAYLVGGDFFQLHGFRFLYGTGFQPEDVMQDRIVLDELAAWQLFSSNDCVGLPVSIEQDTYYVAGVVERETDDCTAEVYGESPRVYLSYKQWNQDAILSDGETTPVTFCEAVLPEPVDDFALSTFAEAIHVDEDSVRNNTERFDLAPLWENLQSLHLQGVLSNAVVYPYWESAAILAANQRSILLIPMLIFLILPVGWAIYAVIWAWRLIKAGGYGVYMIADRVNEHHKTNRYLKVMAERRREKERMIQFEDNDEEEPVSVAGIIDDDVDAGGL